MNRRLLKSGAIFLLGVIIVASVAGHLGFVMWVFDLFAHFRPQYAATSICLLIVFIAARAWRWAIMAAIAAAVNSGMILPYCLPASHGVDHSSGHVELHLLQFNARSSKQSSPDEFVAFLNESEADLVFIQEVGPELLHKLDTLKAKFDIPPRIATTQTAILISTRSSKFKQVICREVNLLGANADARAESAIEVNVDLGESAIQFLTVHPPPPFDAEMSRLRDGELAGIASWANSAHGPAIVVGDLNTTPWGFSFRKLLRDADLLDGRRGFGLNTSWPTRTPKWLTWMLSIPIDHCLPNRLVQISRFRAGGSFGSDHRLLEVSVHVGSDE